MLSMLLQQRNIWGGIAVAFIVTFKEMYNYSMYSMWPVEIYRVAETAFEQCPSASRISDSTSSLCSKRASKSSQEPSKSRSLTAGPKREAIPNLSGTIDF